MAQATREKITDMIGSHGMWKWRLKEAVDTGESEWKPEEIRADDRCEFGKWLYHFPPTDRGNHHWEKVRTLHREFHLEAARILELVLAGEKKRAEDSLKHRGCYTTTSSQLTLAMTQWASTIDPVYAKTLQLVRTEIVKYIAHISVHGVRKRRLLEAVQAMQQGGRFSDTQQLVTAEPCEFGHWMDVTAHKFQNHRCWRAVENAHDHFHDEERRIVQLARSGAMNKALAELDYDGSLERASQALTRTMIALLAEIDANPTDNPI